MEYIIGIVIGILLGLTGAGGSLFAVPLIIYFLNLSTADAMGIALGAVCISAASGLLKQLTTILWLPGLLLAVAGVITAPIGKWLAEGIAESWLIAGFSVLAMIIASSMWLKAVRHPEQARVVRATIPPKKEELRFVCRFNDSGQFQLNSPCVIALIAGGIVIGFLSGLFGVGGGFLIVPYLFFLGRCSMPVAIATSLLIISLISASGFIAYLFIADSVEYGVLVKIIVAGILGMLISQKLSPFIANDYLQKIFAILLLAVAVISLMAYL